GDVARALPDLPQRPLAGRCLDEPWPCAEDQAGGDQEGHGVEAEDDRGAARLVHEGGERRPHHQAAPPRDPHQAVRRGERRLLDDERHEAAHGRVEEPVAEPDDDREEDEAGEGQVSGRVERGERADREEAPDVGDDHHPAPLVAVGERAAEQERRQHRARLAEQDDVVLLPEKWNAIGSAETLREAAETLESGESVEAMRGWARTHGITLVGGSITERREGREKLSNTSLVFDPEGELVALYRKIHLF